MGVSPRKFWTGSEMSMSGHTGQTLESYVAGLLIEEPSKKGKFRMADIPNTNEIILFTESTITHFRYLFEGDLDVVYEILVKVEIHPQLPSPFKNKCIIPLAVAPSSDYSVLFTVDETIILANLKGNRLEFRMTLDQRRRINGTEIAMMIPDKEMAVVGGDYYTIFVSTSVRQKGVNKDRLRILHEKYEDIVIERSNSTREVTTIARDGIVFVYVLREKDLTVWKIEECAITLARSFEYNNDNIAWKIIGGRLPLQERSFKRQQYKLLNPATVHYYPVSAMILGENTQLSHHELLIISCESGIMKVISTEDILKNTLCEFIPLGNKKLPVQTLFPCWKFPLDPLAPLSQLIGLSNGTPISIKMENGSWNVTDIVHSRKVVYSHAKSRVSSGGYTVSVFHNKNDLFFCFFSEGFQWKEDRLDDEITECFIHERIVAVLTDKKLLILDMLGLFCKDEEQYFHNDSIGLDSLIVDNGSKVLPQGFSSIIVSASMDIPDENVEDSCWISFKNRNISECAVTLNKSPLSQKVSLQEVYNRRFAGKVKKSFEVSKSETQPTHITTTKDGKYLRLLENGSLARLAVNKNELVIEVANLFDNPPKTTQSLGFVTIEGTDSKDGVAYIVTKEKEYGDFIYLDNAEISDDMTVEPIPYGFGDKPIFGHFVGPKEEGRCYLYTTSTRKFGDIPELIRIEARVNHVTERMTIGASLFQPDTMAQLIPHYERYRKRRVNVVSTYGATIEIHELNGKGRMKPVKEIELKTKDGISLYISSFDTYYVHSSNTVYIVEGSSSGELAMVTWDSQTIEQNNGKRLEKVIREVFFFGKEHATEPPRMIAYSNDTELKVYLFNLETKSRSLIYGVSFPKGGSRWDYPLHNFLTICNGDDKEIHDMWTISNREALLHPGRKTVFDTMNIRKCPFVSWTGQVESVSLLSTRTNETRGMYADLIFVVKEKCQIGILATVQEFGLLPDKILFTEFRKITKSNSIAIHGELLDCSFEDPNRIEVDIRLFVARRKSIKIFQLKLSIESGVLRVKNIKLGNIPTTILDPSHIMVTSMEEIPDRSTPKYAIISGAQGTETVRICEKKLHS